MFKVTYQGTDQDTLTFTVQALTETTRVSKGYHTENIYTVLQQLNETNARGVMTLPQLQRIQKKLLNPVDTQNEYCVVGEDFSVRFETIS